MFLSGHIIRLGLLLCVLLSVPGVAQDTNSEVLYYKCTKWLKIGRPLSEKATYKVKGGSCIRGQTVKDISIYPTKLGTLQLTITTRRPSKVTHLYYKVLPAPKPHLRVTDQWVEPISEKNRPRHTDKMVVFVKPQEVFRRAYPKDAKYRCNKVVCKLYRNGRLIRQMTFTGQTVDLKKMPIRSKDKIVINVEAERINSRGVREKVEVSNPNFEYVF
ncbi:hypothetical protein [Microscilla marina]|uniref:Gliding motility-associated protein GldM C-terminal domain-containing protein n=1 Tax=Microscilla marina ATCC 23134 TaxID=313606 RepID=A1ZCS7_MICM2|nr:hypothetical protein [Microscilla marina]EAY32079.1 hypothetical protein M23134_02108 [Microscilla marina ATCC 23134]